jgi:hypothetical protein
MPDYVKSQVGVIGNSFVLETIPMPFLRRRVRICLTVDVMRIYWPATNDIPPIEFTIITIEKFRFKRLTL